MQCSRARVDGQRFATARRHANAALRAVERLIDWRKKIDGASAWHPRPTTTAHHFLNQPKRAIARLLIKNIARRARRRTSCGANTVEVNFSAKVGGRFLKLIMPGDRQQLR